jgi:predicted ATPase/transcriptional regulator with XRE-family HTH domain
MAAKDVRRFGALLRRQRLAAGLTQEMLAERAGISAKAIRGLERDPQRTPRLDTVALLADALRLAPEARADFLAAARPDSIAPAAPSIRAAPIAALPRPLTPLIGREGVASAVAALLRRGESQLLTLTGPGGVGKTRLAIAVASRVAADFADGTVFVDLAPLRDPTLLLPTVAVRLGLDERDATSLTSRLAAALCEKQLLLLLDNFEHLVAGCDALLPLLEACPRLTVLATSRVALRVRGEREFRVAPLELPTDDTPPEALPQLASAALFIERARALGVELEPDAATAPVLAQICRHLDGLPLAIELAAAWTRLLPLPTLLARLERRLPLLVGGAHDLPARQRTMRDAIAWSYDLLDAPSQRLFRQLAVFAGGCTLEAAADVSVAARTADAGLARLAVLADRSLLRFEIDGQAGHDGPRLTTLETIREYGLERLEECGEGEATRERHAAHFLALAESAAGALGGADGLVWRARLAREHDNLRAALDWLIGHGNGERALRLAAALVPFWSERGHLSEGRRRLREALAMAGGNEEVAGAQRKALIGAAILAIEQSAYDEAAALCEQAIAMARARAERRDLVSALNARGMLARARGRYAEAMRDYDEARALAADLDDRTGEAVALNGLAIALGFAGDVARSRDLAERSVAAFRALQDARGLAEALVSVMWHATNAGDGARVQSLGEEALTYFRALGDTGRMAEVLFMLGITAQFGGDFARAAALHEEGLALRLGRGDTRGAVEQQQALAAMALQQGDLERARTLLEETLATLRGYDDPWSQAMSMTLLAQVALATDAVGRAEALLGESAAIYSATGNLLYVPWCLEGLAGVANARGDWVRAAQFCGMRDALRARIASPLPPCYPASYARVLASIEAALGADGFAAAHSAGERLPTEAALAVAAAQTRADRS